MIPKPSPAGTLLVLILVAALGLRLVNIGFGLPAMYDPDEPMFVLKAFKLLDARTLNPGWFGHPGTTTIYLLALVDLVVAGTAFATGSVTSLSAFAAAVYADPAIIFVPSRLAMVAISMMTIAMTFLVGRRLFGTGAALAGTAFLALNALHIAWSQVIRTDIHASLFMITALFFAIRAAQGGRRRDLIVAGLAVGMAMATKWPGGCAFVGVLGAGLLRLRRPGIVAEMVAIGGSALAVPVGLFLASPFILIDWQTAWADVGGEVASGHLGHNGNGLLANLRFYMIDQLGGTMGWVGLALAVVGFGVMAARPVARATVLPTALLFLLLISVQPQIWSRWLTPVLPLLCLAAGLVAAQFAGLAARQLGPIGVPRNAVRTLLVTALLVPSASAAWAGMRERSNDTRRQASAWARAHIPAGSVVIVEHLALDLDDRPWTILFPIGAAWCVDGRGLLSARVDVEDVGRARKGSPIVDLGNIPAGRLKSCRGDYAILTYYDLYLAERDSYPKQVSTYRQLIGRGATVAVFRPVPGSAGGPTTRIVALRPPIEGAP